MAITVSLNVTPTTPAHGATITATYVVSGNAGTPAGEPQSASITGDVTVGGDTLHAVTTITLPGSLAVPPLAETFAIPTAPGLTFVPVAGNPKAFTAVVA